MACSSRCLYVDPVIGDDSADATYTSPIRTVGECLYRARTGWGRNASRAEGEVHKCLLRSGVYTENVAVRGVDHVSIE